MTRSCLVLIDNMLQHESFVQLVNPNMGSFLMK